VRPQRLKKELKMKCDFEDFGDLESSLNHSVMFPGCVPRCIDLTSKEKIKLVKGRYV